METRALTTAYVLQSGMLFSRLVKDKASDLLTLRKRFRDTFFDGVSADGGYTEAKLAHAASVSCIRFFPRAQYISGRYAGGTFVGFTKSGAAVPLATIAETPSLKWQLLNVTARTEVVSVRYNSPDGGFGNMAEIEVYGRK